MPALNEQLQALIQLQDTDIMLREAQDPEFAREEERLGFQRENLKFLERTRQRLASRVDQQLLRTYERMSRKFTRVVVPVEGNACVGCRMSLPTSSASRPALAGSIESCENCGRILYRL